MRHTEADGLTTNEACAVLLDLARNVSPEHNIVEVGVFRGKSLLALAEGSLAGNQSPVWGIDPWNLARPSKPKYSSDETYAAALAAVESSEASHLIKLVKNFSASVAGRWDSGLVGLWYLDADHRKLPVLADFAAWRPHFAPGAVVAFDDCHPDFPGVIEAVNCLWQKKMMTRPQMLTDRLAVATVL